MLLGEHERKLPAYLHQNRTNSSSPANMLMSCLLLAGQLVSSSPCSQLISAERGTLKMLCWSLSNAMALHLHYHTCSMQHTTREQTTTTDPFTLTVVSSGSDGSRLITHSCAELLTCGPTCCISVSSLLT